MRALEQFAAEISGTDRLRAIPLPLIIAVLQAAVQILVACQPTPAGGYEWLREPPYGLAGFRRRAWARRIRDAVGRSWAGPPEQLADVQDAVLTRLRAGVSLETVRRVYAGCR